MIFNFHHLSYGILEQNSLKRPACAKFEKLCRLSSTNFLCKTFSSNFYLRPAKKFYLQQILFTPPSCPLFFLLLLHIVLEPGVHAETASLIFQDRGKVWAHITLPRSYSSTGYTRYLCFGLDFYPRKKIVGYNDGKPVLTSIFRVDK